MYSNYTIKGGKDLKTILKFRIPIMIVLLGITVFFGMNIKKMKKETGLNGFLPTDNPDYKYKEEAEKIFGAQDQFVIGVSFKDSVYSVKNIECLKNMTEFIEELPHIDYDDVTSVISVKDMENIDSELCVERIVDEDDLVTEESVARIMRKVCTNPMLKNKIVSEDEKSAVIIAPVESGISDDAEKSKALLIQIKEHTKKLEREYPCTKFYISGKPPIAVNKSESMSRDLKVLFPAAVIIVIIMLIIILRRVFGVITPLIVTISSIIWVFGLKGLIGSPLTLAETVMPVMLIAIGCADGIHIVSEFFKFKRRGYLTKEAVSATMKELTMPVLMTSITTAIGFASLITSPGISLKNMGIFLALGTMVAWLFSFLFIPSFLSFVGNKKKNGIQNNQNSNNEENVHHTGFDLFLGRLTGMILKNRIVVFVVIIAILFLSIFALFKIHVEASDVFYLKKDNWLRVATEEIQKSLGGVFSLDVVIEGENPDSMKDPNILKIVEDFQKFAEKHKHVSYSLSAIDLLKRINFLMNDNDPVYNRLPNETEFVEDEEIPGYQQVAQYLLLYEMGGGSNITKYIDSDYKRLRINLRLANLRTEAMSELLSVLKPYIKEHFPKTVKVRFTNHYINYIVMNLIIESQIISLITILILITIIMSIIFRSPVVGIITALPVFIAVLFNFTIMWLLRIPLDMGNAVIASAGMGVGIDYAIHYFSRFKTIFKEENNYETSAIRAVCESGKPILSNAFAVGIGFLVLMLSDYFIICNMGWIIALSMFTTAIGALTIIPALVVLVKPKIK